MDSTQDALSQCSDEEDYDKLQQKMDKILAKMNKKNDDIARGSLQNILKLPFSLVSYGSSRGGKSTKILQLFKDARYGLLERIQPKNIYVISPTQCFDNTMKDLKLYLLERAGCEDNFITNVSLSNTIVKQIVDS